MPITRIDSDGLSSPFLGVGTTTPLSTLHVRGDTSNNAMRISVTGQGSTTLRLDTWNGTDGGNESLNRNWAIRNRYNNFGLLEFMRSTDNTSDPLTSALAIDRNGQVMINRTSTVGTTNVKFAVNGATWQGATINGSVPFPGPAPQTLLNVISEFGVGNPVRIRVFGTENNGNRSHSEYLLISSTYDSVTFFVGLTQMGRINLNNNFGNMYLFLQGYGGAYTDATQTMSGTAANCNLRINNSQNAYGDYSVTWELWR
jgi:hypothetical protein